MGEATRSRVCALYGLDEKGMLSPRAHVMTTRPVLERLRIFQTRTTTGKVMAAITASRSCGHLHRRRSSTRSARARRTWEGRARRPSPTSAIAARSPVNPSGMHGAAISGASRSVTSAIWTRPSDARRRRRMRRRARARFAGSSRRAKGRPHRHLELRRLLALRRPCGVRAGTAPTVSRADPRGLIRRCRGRRCGPRRLASSSVGGGCRSARRPGR